jgi:hypothetical protein
MIERDGVAYCAEHRKEIAVNGVGCPAYIEFSVDARIDSTHYETSTHPEQGRPYPWGIDDETTDDR